MPIDATHITAIGLGIALSACCGFRVFIPLLAASAAGYFGWYNLSESMQWMASLPALICFGSAAIMEILAYYVPFIDNLLDTIAAPLSVVAGTLVASSVLPMGENESLIRWAMAFLAGGATAGTIQLGTGLLRLFSTKTTAGTGNVVVATTENGAAIAGSSLSFLAPLFMATIIVILVLYILYRIFRKFTKS